MVSLSLFYLGILGAIFWSFASALIPRIREKRNMSKERSACPACNHILSVFDLFPILSYVFLRGKCRYCKASIPPYHFLLEVCMCILFMLVGYLLADMEAVIAGNLVEISRLAFLLSSAFVAVTFSVYDLLYMEVPDEVILPFIFAAFALLSFVHFSESPLFSQFLPFKDAAWLASPLINALVGAFAIYCFFLFQIIVSNGVWLGAGDLRIAIFMGLVAGAKIAWLGLFLGYIIGSIFGLGLIAMKGMEARKLQIPFWPYLAAGLFIALFFHAPILDWYLGLFAI